jgi:hypothetical protein
MRDEGVGQRVYLSALIAWPIVVLMLLVHLIFDPFRTEGGRDALMIIGAVPGFLLGYGFYTGLTHVFLRRYRTRRLLWGLCLHVLLLLTLGVVLRHVE